MKKFYLTRHARKRIKERGVLPINPDRMKIANKGFVRMIEKNSIKYKRGLPLDPGYFVAHQRHKNTHHCYICKQVGLSRYTVLTAFTVEFVNN